MPCRQEAGVSLGLASGFPEEDITGLPVWTPTPIFAHFWEYPVGCQGTRKSLDVLGSKGRDSLNHTSVGSSSGAKRGSGEGIRRWGLVVFTEHLLMCQVLCSALG